MNIAQEKMIVESLPSLYPLQGYEEAAIKAVIGAISSNHENDLPDTNVGDTISRKKAVEALDKRFDSIPMDQTTAILLLRRDLRELPPAEPQIIRCKECRHRDEFGCCKYWVGLTMGMPTTATDDDDFCSYAERRTE